MRVKRLSLHSSEVLFHASAILLLSWSVHAQHVGTSITTDGAMSNPNAMLDIQSPLTDSGKGLLIPRITETQRTNASEAEVGGLLNNAGELRGGAAQGLIVYQTDGTQGFYYNTSTTTMPAWTFIGGGGGDGDFYADGSVPMTGNFNLGGHAISNVGTAIEFTDSETTIGSWASGTTNGTVLGCQANGSSYGAAMGYQANAYKDSVAIGYRANGHAGGGLACGGVTIGYRANGYAQTGASNGSVAIGYWANARASVSSADGQGAVAVGSSANGYVSGVALGHIAIAYYQAVGVGHRAWVQSTCSALGYRANAYVNGTAMGYFANSGNQNYSVAKGAYSRCMRYNEEWKGADTLSLDPVTDRLTGYNKYGYGQANWYGVTANATATEIFLGTTGKRFVLQDNSTVSFNILVVAVNTTSVTGDSSIWEISGVVKRRLGAATTALVGANVITMANTQGTLTTTPAFTADTTNGSLKLTVTGLASTTVRWNAMITYSEVRE